ncbi:hypothetical protein H7Y29_01060 [Microbacteriaceae bacterium]|nr:hypothetical protein [Candidatus Saccharibacteria bacterium]
MNDKQGKSEHRIFRGPDFEFAEQLVDNPDQLQTYDRAKWNLLGHADKERRFQGHHPWPKRCDREGVERTLSVPVFTGYSAATRSVMIVRKDPWTHPRDPASWLVAEQNLETGVYIEPEILSSSVDVANQLWLQLAPSNYTNWPPGLHPSLHAPRYDQLRVSGRLDDRYLIDSVEYREGMYGKKVTYDDLEVLEAMIVAVQLRRQYEDEACLHEAYEQRTRYALGDIASKAA